MEFLFDCVSLRLNLNEFFSCLICIFVCFCLFVKLLMSTSLEAFHSLIEITSCIHFQPLLFPRLTICRSNYLLENPHFFSLSSFFVRLKYDLLSNQLYNIKSIPYFLQSYSRVSLFVIVNNQSLSRSGDRSIE